jgi:hypothetical protein
VGATPSNGSERKKKKEKRKRKTFLAMEESDWLKANEERDTMIT